MRPALPALALLFFLLDASQAQPVYTVRAEHDPDGIGKFYEGREIAQVMGHEGADWLERPERMREERPDLLLTALRLQPGNAVADIGAGTGYLSWRMAQLVGNKGHVYANDIQPEMLEFMKTNMVAHHTTNVSTVLGTFTDVNLPTNSVDLAIMVDVYHEFDHPYEMMQSIVRAVRPGGRIVWVEYRGEDANVPIKPLHKMTVAQVRKEAAVFPLKWQRTIETLPQQHIIIFQKNGP
jgi:ubiquinone/menaquinone biosynthesis C-methylase UbiE